MEGVDENDGITNIVYSELQSRSRVRNCAPSIRIGDLRKCTWFAEIKSVAVDMILGTSFLDHCIL